MAEQRDIKYVNREFGDLKQQLIEFAKNYFPDTYNDFSETSPGTMFMEMAAYVGDILSFYQDIQLQETFLQHAQNPSNLYNLAYMMGYRPKVTSVSEVILDVTQEVPALAPNYLPDWSKAVRILENTIIIANTKGSPSFLLQDPVDFAFSSSYDPTAIEIASITGGEPATYLLRKQAKAFSGTVKTFTKTFTSAERFATIEIADVDIISVLDIVDSDGYVWTEVPFLGQDTVFVSGSNTGTDSSSVPNLLLLEKVPRRFVTRFTSKGILQIQFGAGIIGSTDDTFIPDPTNLTGGYNTRSNVNALDYAYDPSNFLFTRSYGLAPSNTTLTIRYITGGGVAANVPANTINKINVLRATGDEAAKNTVMFNNTAPATGGRDGDTVEELRQNSLRSFAEQQRAVTLQDFNIRALSIPPRYGSIAKVYVTQDYVTNSNLSVLDRDPLTLALYVLAYDGDGHLTQASPSLKENLRTYLSQYMLLTDSIDIKDAFIVNIDVKFEIITLPSYASRDVLLSCNLKLQEYFEIKNWSINEPINLSKIYTLLDKVKGVQTVKNIQITNKAGGWYSPYAYDISGATKGNIVYPSYDPCIFEIKYPDTDIEGRITTL